MPAPSPRRLVSKISRFRAVFDARSCVSFQNVNLALNIPRLLRIAVLALCVFPPVFVCAADDKPRVTITVAKRSVGRPASKAVAGVETGRPQSLFAAVENLSIRTLPEGSLRWTAVIRKFAGGSLKYSGTEVVNSLRPFQSAEIQCGLFEIDSRPGFTSIERDRIDYEVVYIADDKEIARSASVSNFAALALKTPSAVPEANPAAVKPEDAVVPKKPADEKPVMPPLIGAEKMPPTKPALPAAEIRHVEIPKSADALPPPNQPFDFFNLRGKKVPAAK